MIILHFLLASAYLCAGAHAQTSALSLRMSSFSNSISEEGQLKAWLEDKVQLRERLNLKSNGSDMRDALASQRSTIVMPAEIARAKPSKKRALLEKLPGMKPSPFENCRTLKSCPEAPMALYAENFDLVEDAIAALLRPWILLQKARGGQVEAIAARGSGDKVVKVSLHGLPRAVFGVHVSAVPSGGFMVRLRGYDLAALYSSQRIVAMGVVDR